MATMVNQSSVTCKKQVSSFYYNKVFFDNPIILSTAEILKILPIDPLELVKFWLGE